jgi:predicted secreted protein
MQKKVFLVCVTVFICVSGLWAGDTANFVDLGFSANGRIYMFGQYGVQFPALRPWADLFIVDVSANNFVPGGRISHTQNSAIRAGQDGSGVLYRLISENKTIVDRHGVSFPNQGQPLFISLNTNPPASGETIDFRDFLSGKSYKATLVPAFEGTGRNLRSSFIINLESNTGGQIRRYVVGTPQVKRPMIMSYNFNRVLIDPAGDSIIFVIEMKVQNEGGHNIRYMVEALRL